MLAIEFGSHKQGCSDIFSDKDILLIEDNYTILNSEKLKFKSLGYSVRTFNTQKVKYLLSHGSLFFKHIIDEGVVLIGDELLFTNFKNDWVPKNNYIDEIESNIDLLQVLEFIPKNNYGLIVAVDILICSLRNVLIRKLANKSIYSFSWMDIIYKSIEFGLLKHHYIPYLLCARKIKNAYRNNVHFRINYNFLEKLNLIAREVIYAQCSIKFVEHNKIIKLPEMYIDSSYKQLRAIEMLCAYYEFPDSLNELSCLVRDPSYFCSVPIINSLKNN